KRNKEFIYLITIQPLLIFLLMSFLLPYSKTHNVAVADFTENAAVSQALEKMEGIKAVTVSEDAITEKLINGSAELAVIVHADGTAQIIGFGASEIEGAVTLCVENALSQKSTLVKVNLNAAPKRGMPIGNSLGFMIFKTLTASNLLAALLIQERNNKMKDRIMLSGIRTGSYIGGMAFVYLVFMMIGSAVYYLAARLFNFNLGMKQPLGFLLMMFTANVLSVAIYLFASTLVKKEDSLWFMASFVLLPMALFSGVLFPYEFMPDVMQKIGMLFPQRWLSLGIENMQKKGTLTAALPQMAMVLGLSAVLFVIAVIRSSSQNRIYGGKNS
ncbi:MAG: ABC transporter permease, partial [Oscillospiraceae bacterium]|nr:ABC transporter permease [Oscillospiraceae bacterium]